MDVCATRNSLEWGGILSSANPPRRIDGADGTASIAITTPMRHALGARVRVKGIVRDGRHGHIAGDGVRSRHWRSIARRGDGMIVGG